MSNFLQSIEGFIGKAWADFQAGLKWFNTEAAVIGQWLQKNEPAVAAAAQAVIVDAEKGAEWVVQYGGDALSQAVTVAAPVVEEALISHMSTWMGGGMAKQLETAAGQSLFADGVKTFHALVDTNAAKLMHAAAQEGLKLEGDLAPPGA